MDTVLRLQLLPAVADPMSCADSSVSCPSNQSCISNNSCASYVSDKPPKL